MKSKGGQNWMPITPLKGSILHAETQNEVSIETQVELGKVFVKERGWKLVEIYTDAAMSGTSFKSRPGIQALLNRIKSERIDVVLCVTVDRLSRDVEHSTKLLKDLRYRDVELWTVQAGTPVTDMELGLRAVLSHEMIEQIRYRTREGMKTAVRKGSASTCLSYGYKLGLRYDGKGDRIPGLREIDDVKAEIVIRIFREYASGVSPRDIAKRLNAEGIDGPRGLKWRDTAIRGHVSRGTGILNNEIYLGRMIWNKQNYRKNPESERRTARANDSDQWVTKDVPEMRIVSDQLWAKVKKRQAEVGDQFTRSSSNPLNGTHRKLYLLSGLLECAECGGPYAISGKDRYSCTNHRKALPIDALGGECCSNTKTILRKNVEDRVLSVLPAAFYAYDMFEKVSKEYLTKHERRLREQPDEAGIHNEALKRIDDEQKNIIKQITDRAVQGRPHLSALDDVLDQLEVKKAETTALLSAAAGTDDDLSGRLAKLRADASPESVERLTNMAIYMYRDKVDTDVKQPLVTLIGLLVQKVVIGKTPGHQPAELEVHGRISSILAAMEASMIVERQFKHLKEAEYLEKIDSGELVSQEKRKEFLDAYAEELSVRRDEWKNIQVSVVAGAGFEPAAFRL